MPPLLQRLSRSSVLRRFSRSRDGAMAVEFGMIGLPFLGLIFAILELGYVQFTAQTVERSVYNAGRQIMTGAVARSSPTPQGRVQKFKTDLCNQLSWIVDCNDIIYDVQAFKTYGDTDMNLPIRNGSLDMSKLPRFNPGVAGEVVVVRVYYQVPVVTSYFDGLPNLAGNKRLVTGTFAFKNEPFGTTGNGT